MISIWDDHEVQDNYAGGAGPTAGCRPSMRYSNARRDAAYRAFFETHAVRTAPSGRAAPASTGGCASARTVDLMLLDQRQYRADQPCGDAQLAARVRRPATSRAPSSGAGR